jgi:hypothetical protein
LTQPPTAEAGPDLTVAFGELVTLDGSQSLARAARITSWSWTQLDGPPVQLRDPAEARTGFVAPPTEANLRFRLTIIDDAGGRDADDVVVRVRSRSFGVDLGPGRRVAAGERVTIDAQVSGVEDPTRVEFRWRQLRGPDIGIEGASGASIAFNAPARSSIITVEATATDAGGAEASDRVTIRVSLENLAPIARTTQERYELRQGEVIRIDGTPSFDPDGGIASFTWVQVDGPPGAILPLNGRNAGIVRISRPTIEGTYQLELTVADEIGAVDSTTVEVEVTDNPGPRVEIDFPTSGANLGGAVEAFAIRGAASDPDGIVELRIGDVFVPVASSTTTEFSVTVPWPGGPEQSITVRVDDVLGARTTARLHLLNALPLQQLVDLEIDAEGNRAFAVERTPPRVVALDLGTGGSTLIADVRNPDPTSLPSAPSEVAWDSEAGIGYVSSFGHLFVVDPGLGQTHEAINFSALNLPSRPEFMDIDVPGRRIFLGSTPMLEVSIGAGGTLRVREIPNGSPVRGFAWSAATQELLTVDDNLLGFDPELGESRIISGPDRGSGPRLSPISRQLATSSGGEAYSVQLDEVLEVDLQSGDRSVLVSNLVVSQLDFHPGTNQLWALVVDPLELVEIDAATGMTSRRLAVPGGSGVGSGPDLKVTRRDRGGLARLLDDDRVAVLTDTSMREVDLASSERRDLLGLGFGPTLGDARGAVLDRAGRRLLVTDRAGSIVMIDLERFNRMRIFDDRNDVLRLGDVRDLARCDERLYIVDGGGAVYEIPENEALRVEISGPDVGSGPDLVAPTCLVCRTSAQGHRLVAADAGGPDGSGRLLQIDPATGAREVLSTGDRGPGPIFGAPRGVDLHEGRDLAVVATDDRLYTVELATGRRRAFSDPDRASGPRLLDLADVLVDDERDVIFVQDVAWGALFAVDLDTGLRMISSR